MKLSEGVAVLRRSLQRIEVGESGGSEAARWTGSGVGVELGSTEAVLNCGRAAQLPAFRASETMTRAGERKRNLSRRAR